MKIFSGVALSAVLMTACIKSDTKCSYSDSKAVATAAEIDSIQRFLSDTGLIAAPDATGFFYKISNNGSGPGVTNLCSNVTVTYKGVFFNGHVFDSTTAGNVASFQLGQVIAGWQKGLPLISKGGDISLYIPPSLGYGSSPVQDNQGNVIIPASSYLIFNIHVMDIQ
ncbi:MAG: FKBP-type peptidyl-prolyl cis-trans isomerase [Ginsengibacter sp.]